MTAATPTLELVDPLISHVSSKILSVTFLFPQTYPLSYKTSWILDNGATHHVSCNPILFSSLTSIEPIVLSLPNGHFVTVMQSGTVTISATLILYGVFYVPSFSLNLISVSSLTSNLSCSIIFLPHYCLIQNQAWGSMIGRDRLENNLYFLDTSTSSHSTLYSTSVL